MGAFQNDTALTERDGVLYATLSRDWEIWGPNGGYVAAIALRAAGKRAPAGHRPATISVQYLSVAQFDEITAEVEPVRQGRSAWCLNVALVQNGKRFLQAQVWTTDRSDGPVTREIAMPDVAPPSALKTFQELVPDLPPGRGFWTNFNSKPLKLYSREDPNPAGSVVQEWYRYRDCEIGDDVFADCARTLILIDTFLWPAHHNGLKAQADYIAPSLDVTVWFNEPPRGCEWIFVDAHSATAGAGLVHGVSRCWSEDGRLLATGGSHMLVARRGG